MRASHPRKLPLLLACAILLQFRAPIHAASATEPDLTPKCGPLTKQEIAAYEAAEASRKRLINYWIRLQIAQQSMKTSIESKDAARTRRIRIYFPNVLEAASHARMLSEEEVKSVPEFQEVTKFLTGLASSVGLIRTVWLNDAEDRAYIQSVLKPLPDDVVIRFAEEFLKTYQPVDESRIPVPSRRSE